MGARIGALLLDGLFINIIAGLLSLVSVTIGGIFAAFGTFLYYGVCEGSPWSATLGKKICGLVVLDEQGRPLTFGKSFLRSLCRLVSGAILGIGYIIGLADSQGKALHDKMAGTFVAQAQAAPAAAPPVPAAPPVQRSFNMNGYPQIIGVAGKFAGKAFSLPQQGVIMGRDSASCEFVFPESTQGISRNHCRVVFNPQTRMFVLYDLGSSYGTFLGTGVRVSQGQPMALRPGDEFYLASRANLFRVSL